MWLGSGPKEARFSIQRGKGRRRGHEQGTQLGLGPGRLPGRGNTQVGVIQAAEGMRVVHEERCGSLNTGQSMKDLSEECGSGITSSTKSSLTLAPAQGGTAGSALSCVAPSSDLHQGAQACCCTASQPLGHTPISPWQTNEGGLSCGQVGVGSGGVGTQEWVVARKGHRSTGGGDKPGPMVTSLTSNAG